LPASGNCTPTRHAPYQPFLGQCLQRPKSASSAPTSRPCHYVWVTPSFGILSWCCLGVVWQWNVVTNSRLELIAQPDEDYGRVNQRGRRFSMLLGNVDFVRWNDTIPGRFGTRQAISNTTHHVATDRRTVVEQVSVAKRL